jgi:hypothetical protein
MMVKLGVPNFLTHLAVAKRYVEKHDLKGDDACEFFDGNVYPDLKDSGERKEDAHYNKRLPANSVEEIPFERFCRDRIDFPKFFAANRVETPFEKGVLLHLIVDNECYPAVLDLRKLYDLMKSGFHPRAIITASFNGVNEYLKRKYKIDFGMTSVETEIKSCLEKWEKRRTGDVPQVNLLNSAAEIGKLDGFIERVSDIDLDKIAVRKSFENMERER